MAIGDSPLAPAAGTFRRMAFSNEQGNISRKPQYLSELFLLTIVAMGVNFPKVIFKFNQTNLNNNFKPDPHFSHYDATQEAYFACWATMFAVVLYQ